MNELHLFAGAGGGILGGQLIGHTCVCAVEWEPFAQAVLVARQNDKTFPPFPIWDNVQTFNGKPWQGIVDVVAGGFPCQDISISGKGKGLSGERSGMWFEMLRIVCEIQPRYCFIENSPMLTSRGLDRVLADLAGAGFNARWTVLSARDVGAPHLRERMWILAFNTNSVGGSIRKNAVGRNLPSNDSRKGSTRIKVGRDVPTDAVLSRKVEASNSGTRQKEKANGSAASILKEKRVVQSKGQVSGSVSRTRPLRGSSGFSRFKVFNTKWPNEPRVERMADGVDHWSNRTKAIGNGQVSRVAAAAFLLLKDAYLNGY